MSEIRVDSITDEAGTGSPNLPNGLVTPSATVSGDIDIGGALTNGGPAGIQIDSAGRVNMPNQPLFYVRVSDTGQSVLTNNTDPDAVINFQTKDVDIGNDYDLANNRFFAPKDGIYKFDINMSYRSSSSGATSRFVAIRPRINGSRLGQGIHDRFNYVSGVTYGNSAGSYCFNLTSGDYVDFIIDAENSGMVVYRSGSSLFGTLVG